MLFSKVTSSIHSSVFLKVLVKSLCNLVHDFWEDCFRIPKLLLAANRLIYLNISIGISKMYGSGPSRAIVSFLLSFFKKYQGSEYVSISECQDFGYTTVLYMPELHRVLNVPKYAWIIPGYVWMCLNLSEWILFYIYLL